MEELIWHPLQTQGKSLKCNCHVPSIVQPLAAEDLPDLISGLSMILELLYADAVIIASSTQRSSKRRMANTLSR